ncbi:TPA: MaoC family dehydratase [Pseudomonas aeruginosa]|uniref:MaoC family dehydratase n=1 Tax=Pseudomonas aeruginosa TaxID=287 RepID=UPI00136B2AA8|nr:MaoC family dehydratase [Pseudomonas aeruginosa]MXU51427.1 MaoC family dehydratase [Pseudomonas aeruginosa]HBN9845813.1 MaoC family dehydratase [Pseudomonas aeruginosa]HBN9848322.1 MaoC family dehydratase [Pseudomonas aeruginosa]
MSEKQISHQRGLYYEELEVGVIYRHAPGRTLDDGDNTLFSALTMNQASIHVDAHASLENEFGGRLMNSMLTLSTLVGLSVGHLTQRTLVANLGFSNISFPAPVVSGDTLYAETEIQEKRDSKSRPEAGVVLMEHRAFNQRGVLVATAKRYSLMMRNPESRQ